MPGARLPYVAVASIVPPPFGSGYLRGRWAVGITDSELQSCRPLSGAVIGGRWYNDDGTISASIVPPPFGSGYGRIPGRRRPADSPLQSCRPLSGAVIFVIVALPAGRRLRFNRAAPFRERLFFARPQSLRRPARFNRAAPFRERLYIIRPLVPQPIVVASIVPPPFGSGYG